MNNYEDNGGDDDDFADDNHNDDDYDDCELYDGNTECRILAWGRCH